MENSRGMKYSFAEGPDNHVFLERMEELIEVFEKELQRISSTPPTSLKPRSGSTTVTYVCWCGETYCMHTRVYNGYF